MLDNLFETKCYALHIKTWQVNDDTTERFCKILMRHNVLGLTTSNHVDGFILFPTDEDRNAAYEELFFLLPFVSLVQQMAYVPNRRMRQIKKVYRRDKEHNERLMRNSA